MKNKTYVKNEYLAFDYLTNYVVSKNKLMDLSISKICKALFWSRTTFYSHFEGLADLITKYKNAYKQKCITFIKSCLNKEKEVVLAETIYFVVTNRKLIESQMSILNNEDYIFIFDYCKKYFDTTHSHDKKNIDKYVFNFQLYMYLSIIRTWINDNKVLNTTELLDKFYICFSFENNLISNVDFDLVKSKLELLYQSNDISNNQ